MNEDIPEGVPVTRRVTELIGLGMLKSIVCKLPIAHRRKKGRSEIYKAL